MQRIEEEDENDEFGLDRSMPMEFDEPDGDLGGYNDEQEFDGGVEDEQEADASTTLEEQTGKQRSSASKGKEKEKEPEKKKEKGKARAEPVVDEDVEEEGGDEEAEIQAEIDEIAAAEPSDDDEPGPSTKRARRQEAISEAKGKTTKAKKPAAPKRARSPPHGTLRFPQHATERES